MEYSICIRTLGQGGKKYSDLLNSIKSLSNLPKEVIIVLPIGYKPPKEQIGIERFVYCEKGMLMQRIVGYESAQSEYVLLIDDDISFESEMVNKLYNTLKNNNADVTFPIYPELLPHGIKQQILSAVTLSAIPRKSDGKYIKMLPSGGYSYSVNFSELELESESAPGMCVFGKRKAFLDINLREDLWVEYPDYALRDDAILIYKAFLNNKICIGRTDVEIYHLDNAANDKTRRLKAIYAIGFSQISFWYRYIYKQKHYFNKIIPVLSLLVWIMMNTCLYLISSIIRRNKSEIVQYIIGLRDGYKLRKINGGVKATG